MIVKSYLSFHPESCELYVVYSDITFFCVIFGIHSTIVNADSLARYFQVHYMR